MEKTMEYYDRWMKEIDLMYKSNAYKYRGHLLEAYNLVKNIYIMEEPYVEQKDGKTVTTPYLEYQLRQIEILSNNCLASEDLVIASMLGVAILNKHISIEDVELATGKKYGNRVKELFGTIVEQPHRSELDRRIAERLYSKIIEDLSDSIRNELNGRQVEYFQDALELAKETHNGVCRYSGEPYIIHPLRVALMLAELGVESDVVAAALLHDVVEDSTSGRTVSREAIKAISPRVLKYVEAVTSAEEEVKQGNADKESNEDSWKEKGYSSKDDYKNSVDRKTAEKLIKMAGSSSDMKFAVLIKAADRLHNLQTISGMKPGKIVDKVRETEELYLPLFRSVGTNAFIKKIEDRLEYINNKSQYITIKEKYEDLFEENEEEINHIADVIEKVLHTNCGMEQYEDIGFMFHRNYSSNTVKERILPTSIKKALSNVFIYYSDSNLEYIKQVSPMLNISVIVKQVANSNLDPMKYLTLFVHALNNLAKDDNEKIVVRSISQNQSEMDAVCVELEDDYCNRVAVYFYDYKDYSAYQYGNTEAVAVIDYPAEDWRDFQEKETIRVLRLDDKPVEVVQGSTPLDIAFGIHRNVGLYATAASINNRPQTSNDLFKKLKDGDKVVIYSDSKEVEKMPVSKRPEPYVKIEWLRHMESNSAKDIAIRYLIKKYEG